MSNTPSRSIAMLPTPRAATAPGAGAPRRRGPNLALILSLLALLMIIGLAAAAPWIYPGDPLDMVATPLLWPGEDAAFFLGTDALGRDVAAGLVHGARVTLLVAASASVVGLVVGTVVGAVAGYVGGWAGVLLMKITEIFQTVPSFLLVIVVLALGSPSIALMVIAISLASWPMIARLVRAEVMTLRNAEFVMAARALGYGAVRILCQEIMPNVLPSIIVAMSVLIANSILLEAAISFLNLGDPNMVSWGSMIGSGRQMLRTEWYLTALPGSAIVVTVLALNLLGDGLTDLLSPRDRTGT